MVGPLLMYARLAVERRGGQARPIVWELARGSDYDRQRLRVASQVESAVDELTAATGMVTALRRAAAPCLLIGGTADRFWDGRIARSLAADVVEVDGADHGMFVPGRMAASAAVLGQVITAVEDFLDLVWP
jgi:hypothetical protein